MQKVFAFTFVIVGVLKLTQYPAWILAFNAAAKSLSSVTG